MDTTPLITTEDTADDLDLLGHYPTVKVTSAPRRTDETALHYATQTLIHRALTVAADPTDATVHALTVSAGIYLEAEQEHLAAIARRMTGLPLQA